MDLVRSNCLTCHGSDVIRQQRLGRSGWLQEVDKMIRWGAVLTAEQRELTADYLSANFAGSAGSAARASAGDAGVAAIQRRCINCHGTDMVEQQRLGRAGWVREIDKMIRWGAAVSDEEKDPLIDSLAARFGPRKPQ
jgi:mono/diheme cytochrome c family protein